MKSFSFRFRIAALSALVSGLVLVGFALALWQLYCRHRVEALDTEIRALGTRHPGWLANRANLNRLDSALDFIFGEENRGRVILLVKDTQGKVLYSSPDWPKDLAADQIDFFLKDAPNPPPPIGPSEAGETAERTPGFGPGGGRGFGPGRGGGPVVFNKIPRFFTAENRERAWRIGIMGNDDLRMAVGLNYDAVRAELNQVRNVSFLAIPLALVFVAAGGWLVAGRALQPLKAIAHTAEQVTARGLDQRIPLSDAAPEIRRLIEVLNRMIDRLETSFRQATRFTADASHELKTPLAIMQGELENAVQSASQGSPEQEVFSAVLEQTQKLKAITRSLLLLAQADSGQLRLAREPVNLSGELEAMIEDARVLGAENKLRFDLSLESDVWVDADRALLRLALFNLVANAVTYNEANGCVGIALTNGKNIEFTIWNTGPGIPAADQARIFDRFYRVRQSARVARDGIGLGLSLAREIIQAHGGALLLKESRPGHTCFVVSLAAPPHFTPAAARTPLP